MNATTDTLISSIGSYSFDKLVQARQARVAAGRAYDAAEEACTCTGRRCKCTADVDRAWAAYEEAGREVADRQARYSAFLDAFRR